MRAVTARNAYSLLMNRPLPVTGAFILCALTACPAYADYQDKVAADRPAAYWRFNNAASSEYVSSVGAALPAKVEGTIEAVAGPAAEVFPDFAGDNQAI